MSIWTSKTWFFSALQCDSEDSWESHMRFRYLQWRLIFIIFKWVKEVGGSKTFSTASSHTINTDIMCAKRPWQSLRVTKISHTPSRAAHLFRCQIWKNRSLSLCSDPFWTGWNNYWAKQVSYWQKLFIYWHGIGHTKKNSEETCLYAFRPSLRTLLKKVHSSAFSTTTFPEKGGILHDLDSDKDYFAQMEGTKKKSFYRDK